jgi:hypothetical protein
MGWPPASNISEKLTASRALLGQNWVAAGVSTGIGSHRLLLQSELSLGP